MKTTENKLNGNGNGNVNENVNENLNVNVNLNENENENEKNLVVFFSKTQRLFFKDKNKNWTSPEKIDGKLRP